MRKNHIEYLDTTFLCFMTIFFGSCGLPFIYCSSVFCCPGIVMKPLLVVSFALLFILLAKSFNFALCLVLSLPFLSYLSTHASFYPYR